MKKKRYVIWMSAAVVVKAESEGAAMRKWMAIPADKAGQMIIENYEVDEVTEEKTLGRRYPEI